MTGLALQAIPCASEAIAQAIAAYPRESVGLVVVERGRPVYVACENRAERDRDEFKMGDRDWAKAEQRGEIIALIHSHPDFSSKPSMTDLVMCEDSGVPWYIIAVHKNGEEVSAVDASVTKPSGYEAPLAGREFHHGVLDCFTLIKDYYERELGIELPNFKREDDWWVKGQNLYMENFAKAGFAPAPGSIELHDVILMQIRSPVPNHAGVYVGDTRILHHMHSRLSSRDIYGGYLREATRMILRHRSMK